MSIGLTVYSGLWVNKLAEGCSLRIVVNDPLMKLKTNERELVVILTRVSNSELLVSYVNRGSVLLELYKPFTAYTLYRTGLNSHQRRLLTTALRDHMREEREHGNNQTQSASQNQ